MSAKQSQSSQQRMKNLERRRAMAQAMMAQFQQPQGVQMSGTGQHPIAVGSSPWSMLSNAAGMYFGNKMNGDLDSEYDEIAKQMSAEKLQALQDLVKPAVAAPATSSDEGPTRAPVAPPAGFNIEAAQRAIDSGADPALVMQMAKGGAGQGGSIFGEVQPDKFTTDSLARFQTSKNYGDLVPKTPSLAVGKFNPGDYTPESMAQFIQSRNPDVLVRYAKPEIMPVAGGIDIVQPNAGKPGGFVRTPVSSPQTERDAASAAASAKARGSAQGEAAGAQDAKAPILQSFGASATNMRDSIKGTQQGGFLGSSGVLAPAFDKKNSDLFNSRVQQMSAEIRAIFRIPGEGSLSDQEQAQYGLQLPKITNEPETNEQIMNDLEQRVKLRLSAPVGGTDASVTPSAVKKRFNPATGKIE